MNVRELNQDQLNELKWTYLYDTPNAYEYACQIPDAVIFEHYAHISFVEEDFSSVL